MKLKTCNGCNKEKPIWKNDSGNKYCQYCWNRIKAGDKKSAPVKKKKRISPISEKRAGQLATYRVLRDDYLLTHPVCEVHDCENNTTNLHHKNGRIGEMLFNTEYFMACCSVCHPQRIHENPAWARKHGYLI